MKSSRYIKVLFAVVFLIVLAINTISSLIFANLEIGGLYGFIFVVLSSLLSSLLIVSVIVITNPILKKYLKYLQSFGKIDNLNHPLMRKLAKEAPGTYSHSMRVAEISDRAAQAINVDNYLCRIGSYYHDIGKLVNPSIFVENSGQNGDTMSGEVAKKIVAHVDEGIKLSNSNKFPEPVIELISQHHGNSFVGEIRYAGPKPLNKEAAIVMVSDCCEAKVRSIKSIGENTIAITVKSVIEEKIKDGQLDYSDLSKTEIDLILKSIVNSLTSQYHKRIKYKKQLEKN